MADLPSVSQVNRLGERLRKGLTTPGDLQALAAYQRSFEPALATAMARVRLVTARDLASRPEKSVRSIVRKLRREKTRLSKMQDLAGFRVVVNDIKEQDDLVARILATPGDWTVSDRRVEPVHGYRAVHLVFRENRWLVEVQVRTNLQHLWANISEALDREAVGDEVKYGQGPPEVIRPLGLLSITIARVESGHPFSQTEGEEIRDMFMTALREIAGKIDQSGGPSLEETRGS
jgi:hypothetical protein